MKNTAQPASVEPLLVNEREAAALLGVSFWTVREFVASGELPAVQLPCPMDPKRKLRRKLIDRSDILSLIEKHKNVRGGK